MEYELFEGSAKKVQDRMNHFKKIGYTINIISTHYTTTGDNVGGGFSTPSVLMVTEIEKK